MCFGKTSRAWVYVLRQAFKEVVHSCLCKEPAHRPTATQLMQFRFFRVRAYAQEAEKRPERVATSWHKDRRGFSWCCLLLTGSCRLDSISAAHCSRC